MKKIFYFGILLLASVSLNSCGVIFGGSKFSGNIVVKDHPDAEIYVNGMKTGTGKSSGLYRRNATLRVEVKQTGCESKVMNYDYTFRTGNFILSVLMWGIAGIVVDLATGASFKPDHKHNKEIQRINDKEYLFTVDYSGCPVSQ